MEFSKIKLDLVGIPPPKFTTRQWYRHKTATNRTSIINLEYCDKLIAESERVTNEVKEATQLHKAETDHKFDKVFMRLDFLKKEIEIARKNVAVEIDGLTAFLQRIGDLMRILPRCLDICIKCNMIRENRIGIDLCHDNVHRELRKEIQVIESVKKMLESCYSNTAEQIRLLRSCVYLLDRDLMDKEKAISIDQVNRNLKESSRLLSTYHGLTRMDVGQITVEQWEKYTVEVLEKTMKELKSGVHMRIFIDTFLKRAVEDLNAQYNNVNRAFVARIRETKAVKQNLEDDHLKLVKRVNDMTRNITMLELAIREKEGFLALAHTRLGNRAQRPGVELCRDDLETHLAEEVRVINCNVHKLQLMLRESQETLRGLLKHQIQMEEIINIKLNSLKIDEVECMTLRQGINYGFY